MSYERPPRLPRYWVQTRRHGRPWRVAVRVVHLERAMHLFHELKAKPQFAGVRVVHDGHCVASVERWQDEDA